MVNKLNAKCNRTECEFAGEVEVPTGGSLAGTKCPACGWLSLKYLPSPPSTTL
ncbi:MAG: hypothetical protein WCC52_02440 [Nitrosotalea sp.]|jgi:hypothetical protein